MGIVLELEGDVFGFDSTFGDSYGEVLELFLFSL
jgi:hypothetical protein